MSDSEDFSDEEALRYLLLQEPFLTKILVHLVDSGLHECRRVCSTWYRVCNLLPVQLRLNWNADIASVPEKFPNILSLATKETHVLRRFFVEEQILPCISRLRHITHLGLAWLTEWPTIEKIGTRLPSLQSLRSLTVTFRNAHSFLDFLATLSHLTRLANLTMSGSSDANVHLEATMKLPSLRSLSAAPPFLFDTNREMLFDSLRQLTRFELLSEYPRGLLGHVRLEDIQLDALHLRSLSINGVNHRKLKVDDWATLRSFAQLQRLVLRRIAVASETFSDALKDLRLLTEVVIVDVSFSSTASVFDAIFSITNLKALSFDQGLSDVAFCLKKSEGEMTQLTRLCWRYPIFFSWMWSLRQIVHLDITAVHSRQPKLLLWMLEGMPHLQSLRIENTGRPFLLPSCIFLQREKLKSIELRRVQIDLNLFECLAGLRELTELRLQSHEGTKASSYIHFYADVNRLTQLTALEIVVNHSCPALLLQHLSGDRLKSVRELTLPGCRLDDDQRKDLFNRFPCLCRFCYF